MKKTLLLSLALLLGIVSVAQKRDIVEGREKVKALKIAFITQKLEITTSEAEKFWPEYNEYEREIKKVSADNKDDVLKTEEKLLGVRKKYKPRFEKILGAARANELFNVEREFRNVLIKRLKSRGHL